MNSKITETQSSRVTRESLQAFLNRFAEWKSNDAKPNRVAGAFLERLNSAWPELSLRDQRLRAQFAPDFNIFRMLHIEQNEVKLHSRFLAELINPNGSHGQGDLFLLKFFEIAIPCHLDLPSKPTQRSDWWVTTEEWVDEFSRLDIVVRCRDRGFIMAIENKVDAVEQDQQLARYARWLGLQRDFPVRNLVFLTPDGRPPEPPCDGCVCLSYEEHIVSWLKWALEHVEAPSLRLALEHYLQIIDLF